MRYSGFHRLTRRVHREHREYWQVHLGSEIEADRLCALRATFRQRGWDPPSFTAMVVKAISLALRETSAIYPELNCIVTGCLGWRTIHTFERVSAGVAVAREMNGADTVSLAVIEDPEQLPLAGITKRLSDFATKPAHEVPELRNCERLVRTPWPLQSLLLWLGHRVPALRRRYRGTFILTTVGKFDVDWQLTLPQGATLQFGFGVIRDRAVVRHGQVVPAKTFNLTMSFDRRVLNGRQCAVLLKSIRQILTEARFEDWPATEAPQPQPMRLNPAPTAIPA